MTSLPVHDSIVAIEAAGAALAQDSMRRILVVDDEATIRLALSRFLRTRGFEVEVADSGAAALGFVMLCASLVILLISNSLQSWNNSRNGTA